MRGTMSENKYSTKGIVQYPNYYLEGRFRSIGPSLNQVGNAERFVILYIEQGDGTLTYGQITRIYQGPCIILMDHGLAELHLEQRRANQGFVLHFHPCLINSKFGLEQMNQDRMVFQLTDDQDLFMMEPFFSLPSRGIKVLEVPRASLEYLKQLGQRFQSVLLRQELMDWPCLTRSYLIQLLTSVRVFQEKALPSEEHGIPDDLRDMQIFILGNLDRKITIGELVERFNTNRTTLTQRFQTYLKKPVMQYIMTIRMDMAKSLLAKTELKIQEIAYRVGFSDPSLFNRRFSKYFQKTPGEYRKEKQPGGIQF